jgi:hypothetical protein
VTVDLKTALKDKRLLYGVGLAAAAGGAALWTKSKGGGSSSGASGQAATQPTYVGAGSVDTTGTDVASWLGNYSASLQSQYDQQHAEWEDWGKGLLDAIGQMSGSPQTIPSSDPTPQPATPAPAATAPKYQQVLEGWHVDQWIRDIQKGYGVAGGNPNATWESILALNPGLPKSIAGQGSGTNTELNRFLRTMDVRIQ